MLAIWGIGPLGGLAGLVLGIVLVLRRRGRHSAGGIAWRLPLVIAGIVALASFGLWWVYETRPVLNTSGPAPQLAFEVRLPPGRRRRPTASRPSCTPKRTRCRASCRAMLRAPTAAARCSRARSSSTTARAGGCWRSGCRAARPHLQAQPAVEPAPHHRDDRLAEGRLHGRSPTRRRRAWNNGAFSGFQIRALSERGKNMPDTRYPTKARLIAMRATRCSRTSRSLSPR